MKAAATLILKTVLPLAVLGALYCADQRGEERGRLQAQNKQLDGTVQQLSEALERSGQLADSLEQILDTNRTGQNDAKSSIDSLAAGLRSGSIRLSVRTAPEPGPDAGAERPRPGNPEARAELDREDAEALLGLTGEGDAAIRDLNTCIDAYGAVRAIVNKAAP
ncbi:lysis system i-spanin subunit Rz [Comamonas antarctica]|uniref:Bacteriophage Rz lysis protein n=1 Tax=Comamonas antarctica TaxID=2743470 RepID=A0A6N1X4E5_9BURK|nr:lysis system i-spanin subunit Rz [Comamonas antarctica]QKV52650.1 hypothetical protein HUK68_06885 [Comamonas antarctica]